VTARTIATTIHGRYLVIPPEPAGPAPILAGFHGYGEDAETQLERLRVIPDSANWLKVSIQALHCFYDRRTNRVVSSWMTRQQRELAIADNARYVAGCLDAVSSKWPTLPTAVFAGFSQGVAMAFRAAASERRRVTGVIAAGGDIPPELSPSELKRISAVILARGKSDALYPADKFAADKRRLDEWSVRVRALEFEGGHEWSAEVAASAADLLRMLGAGAEGAALYPAQDFV
jgi:predicted esterase